MSNFEKPNDFEKGFSFDCGSNKYTLNTEEIDTHEGKKYRMSIHGQEAGPNATPLLGYDGINAEELKEVVDFARGVTASSSKIEDILKQIQDHIIEVHGRSNF